MKFIVYLSLFPVLVISDINKISNEILSSLNQSLSIIKTKKLNHDKTITTCQKQVKVINNKTSDIVKLVSDINILITITNNIILIHLNGSLFILANGTKKFSNNSPKKWRVSQSSTDIYCSY